MRTTLVRPQHRNLENTTGVRPAAHNSRTCTASKEPYRACRNSASIHSCSGGGISSMVEPRTVRPPRYLGGVATLAIPKRPSLCQSHASWFSIDEAILKLEEFHNCGGFLRPLWEMGNIVLDAGMELIHH